MRIWFMVLVPALAVTGLNKAYTAWRANPPRALTELRGQCIAKATQTGLSSSVGFDLCTCMIDKVSAWKRTYPGAAYTRETHMSLGKECLAALPESSSFEFGSDVFESESSMAGSPDLAPESASGQSREAASYPDSGSEERSANSQPKQYGDPGFGTE